VRDSKACRVKLKYGDIIPGRVKRKQEKRRSQKATRDPVLLIHAQRGPQFQVGYNWHIEGLNTDKRVTSASVKEEIGGSDRRTMNRSSMLNEKVQRPWTTEGNDGGKSAGVGKRWREHAEGGTGKSGDGR